MAATGIRILLAKIGLDGHDRGVKLLARSFRDAGFDVIYTGLWQTPLATVYAAMQEDADIIGVSLHSAAHMTIMPEVLRWRRELGVEYLPVILGGIIPEADRAPLLEMGVAAVFNPGSPLEQILQTVRDLSARRPREPVEALLERYRRRDMPALAQLLTYAQRGEMPEALLPEPSPTRVVGVTGAPGTGKSSLISRLARVLRERGHRVGVIAVDPSSPVSGGALLGDRLRMMSPEPDDGFFVRSLSAGGQSGGLGPHMRHLVRLMSGFGLDVVLVETVGAGQADVAVRDLTPHVLLVLMPEAGDEIQFRKAGIMEIASGFVLNKADLPGADRTKAQLLAAVGSERPMWRISAMRNEGIGEVADWVASLPAECVA